MQRLTDAQQAFLRGEASPEQLHLLEQERAGEEIKLKAEEMMRRRKEDGVWGKVKGLVGVSKGDMGRETVRKTDEEVAPKLLEEGWVDPSRAEDVRSGWGGGGTGRGIMQAVRESRREGEKEVVEKTGIVGGPLDVLAYNVAGAVVPKSDNGWMSWVRGGGKS